MQAVCSVGAVTLAAMKGTHMATNALQVEQTIGQIQPAHPQTFAPRTLQEAFTFANMVIESGFLPKAYVGKPPSAIVVALQLGLELGLQPLQALQSIALINNTPSVFGDTALALIKAAPSFDGIVETLEEATMTASCTVKRRGEAAVTRTFSKADATTANLWGKAGPWIQYPKRMLQMRARSFAIRDQFPDVLKGIATAEEAMDYTVTIDAQPSTTPVAQIAGAAAPPPTVETIGQPGGTEFYKLYAANGWTAGEAAAFLADTLGIVAPKNSKDIPVSEWKPKDGGAGGRAWVWANSASPIKASVVEKFDLLGFKDEERRAFFQANCGDNKHEMYAKVDVALSAEIDKRNAQEQ